jgi:uncharacterized protein (TIGR02597 family)
MKPRIHLPIVAGAAFLAAAILTSELAAEPPSTSPVGFVTLKIAAAPVGGGEQLSFRALSLSRPIESQGLAETAADAGLNSKLTDAQATWTANQFNPVGATAETATHYLEIVRPVGATAAVPGEGTTFDILATDAATKTLTLAGNLPTGVSATAVSYKVRKYWTIADVFGATNRAGLGAGAQGEADEILIYSPQPGQFATYYYRVGSLGGSGWRNADTGANAGAQKIYPEDGIVIRRRQSSDLRVTLLGAIKTGATSSAVTPGLNYLGNVYAADMTLASSGLYTGNPATGVLGGAQGEADDLLIYAPLTKSYLSYYYRIGGIGGSGWRNAQDGTAASSVVIPTGSAIILRRRGAAGFNWIAPQHPAAL